MMNASFSTRTAIAGAAMLAALALTPDAADAQGRRTAKGLDKSQGVPPGQLPPPGQCRVWIDGTAPGQQAAPTDCPTAVQQAASTPGARVLVSRDKNARKGGRVSCDGRRLSYPTTAPRMIWGVQYASGARPRELRPWHIAEGVTAASNDFNNDGTPETTVWRSGDEVVMIWHNPDGDATADIVEIYCNGTRTQQFVY